MERILGTELNQRVADLRMGITNAPVKVVNNERAHLLDLFVAIDKLAAEVKRLTEENAKLAAANADTEVLTAE